MATEDSDQKQNFKQRDSKSSVAGCWGCSEGRSQKEDIHGDTEGRASSTEGPESQQPCGGVVWGVGKMCTGHAEEGMGRVRGGEYSRLWGHRCNGAKWERGTNGYWKDFEIHSEGSGQSYNVIRLTLQRNFSEQTDTSRQGWKQGCWLEYSCNHLKGRVAVSGTKVVGALWFAAEKQRRRRRKEERGAA